jgi:adenine-specific DNA-methyltransferase
MLHYLLDVETQGSQSLLNIDEFNDPTSYTLKVKKLGSEEYVVKNVDLIETFNYLIGLRLSQIGIPQQYNAEFKRNPDLELPQDQHTKLIIDGKMQQDNNGSWWFRTVKGWVPKDPMNPNNGQKENVLIIWRKLTGDLEKDNLMLDEWFQKMWENIHEFEFDTIYVNGSSTLQNLANPEDTWKVRLLEEEFMKRMWDIENV